jgi:hypothetical protein
MANSVWQRRGRLRESWQLVPWRRALAGPSQTASVSKGRLAWSLLRRVGVRLRCCSAALRSDGVHANSLGELHGWQTEVLRRLRVSSMPEQHALLRMILVPLRSVMVASECRDDCGNMSKFEGRAECVGQWNETSWIIY